MKRTHIQKLIFTVLAAQVISIPSSFARNADFLKLPVFCGIFSGHSPTIPSVIIDPISDTEANVTVVTNGQVVEGVFPVKTMSRHLNNELGTQTIPYINTTPLFEPDEANRSEAPAQYISMSKGLKVSLTVIPGIEPEDPPAKPVQTYWSALIFIKDSNGKSAGAAEIGCLARP